MTIGMSEDDEALARRLQNQEIAQERHDEAVTLNASGTERDMGT